jgi:hypothetical protein
MLMIVSSNEEEGSGRKRYKYEGDLNTLTKSDIESFIFDWEADVLEPILKSQKPPEV